MEEQIKIFTSEDAKAKEVKISSETIAEDSIDKFKLAKEMLLISFPTYLFYFALNSQILLNMRKANYMFKDDLSKSNAIGLASIFNNLVGFSILIGMMSGFEVLGPNALGRKDPYLMGVYLHRSRIIGFISAVVSVTLIYFFSVPVMLFMAAEEVDEQTLRSYVVPYSFCLFSEILNRSNYNYLNVVEHSYINIITTLIATVSHFFVLEFFVTYLDFGVSGIAYSMIFTVAFSGVMTTIYIEVVRPIPESVFCMNADCFKDLINYSLFSFPLTLLLCGEWWAWEVLCIITARIDKVSYNTHLGMSCLCFYMFSIGIGVSTSITVKASDFIAEGKIKEVKMSLLIGALATTVLVLFAEIIIFSLKTYFVSFLTEKLAVQENLINFLPIMMIQQLFDSGQFVLNGFMKSMGKQCQATTIVIFTCYIFQTALVYMLGIYFGYGLQGIYIGFTISTAILGLQYSICICFFDFDEIYKETVDRITNAQKALEREELISD